MQGNSLREFMKQWERGGAVQLNKSSEDYLRALLVLQKQMGMVRSIDLACYLGFSKPSISNAVARLRKDGLVTMDKKGFLHMTDIGLEYAEKIYERHSVFTKLLVNVGIDTTKAEEEACKMEHTVSQESFEKIRDAHKDR